MSVVLDAASVRAEMNDSGRYEVAELSMIDALPNGEIEDAIDAVLHSPCGSPFWEQYDEVRTRVIRELIATYDGAS